MHKLSTIKVLELNDETKHLWSRYHYMDMIHHSIEPGGTYVCLGILESENKIYLINHDGIVGIIYDKNIFIENPYHA